MLSSLENCNLQNLVVCGRMNDGTLRQSDGGIWRLAEEKGRTGSLRSFP
jgi:hypothetical protein